MNLAATDALYLDSGGRYTNPQGRQNCAKLITRTGVQVKRVFQISLVDGLAAEIPVVGLCGGFAM